MKSIRALIIMLLLGFSATAQKSWPPPYLINSDTAASWLLDSSYWQILPDKENSFTIDGLIKTPLEDSFRVLSPPGEEGKNASNTYWFRFQIKNSLASSLRISFSTMASKADFYLIDSSGVMKHLKTGNEYPYKEKDGLKKRNEILYTLAPQEKLRVYFRRYSTLAGLSSGIKLQINNGYTLVEKELADYEDKYFTGEFFLSEFFAGLFIMAALFNFFFYLTVRERVYIYFSLFILFIATSNTTILDILFGNNSIASMIFEQMTALSFFFFVHFVRYFFNTAMHIPRWDRMLKIFSSLILLYIVLYFIWVGSRDVSDYVISSVLLINLLAIVVTFFLVFNRAGKSGFFFLTAIAPYVFSVCAFLILAISSFIIDNENFVKIVRILVWVGTWNDLILNLSLAWAVTVFTWSLFNRYTAQRKEIARQALDKERLAKEKEMERNELIASQKVELEIQVEERTAELKQSLEELKAAQNQLIQKEKMASLGELTAGIAHEIQNPLNFVNNFADVNVELIDEMEKELKDGYTEGALAIAMDIRKNLEKISHHGERADAIVKGMLQHSRNNTGTKEPTDINALTDEWLRMAYHGARAKDKSFNTILETVYDKKIDSIQVVPQDIGRVLLNLYNNAFYSVAEKSKEHSDNHYAPAVSVTTKLNENKVYLIVKDNGMGIPENIQDKIFQPFFTTKPTGQGTGLGLSLSYDIVKAHGGELTVQSTEGRETVFTISLPLNGK